MNIRQQLDTTLIELAGVLDGIDTADDTRPTPCDGLNVAALRGHVLQALGTFVTVLDLTDSSGVASPVSHCRRHPPSRRMMVVRR